MRERVLKAITDRERRSSWSHVEGGEGIALVSHEGAPVHDEVHREELSEDATGPSSMRAQFNKRLKETIRTWRSSAIF